MFMKKQSVTITVIFVLFFALALGMLLVTAPWIADWFAEFRGLSDLVKHCILTCFYLCAIPAAVALYGLWRLLSNIRAEQMFVPQNSRILGMISWCCVAVACLTLAACYHYPPFALVSVAMGFIFLIVRVVRGCILAATVLREENSLTI